MKHATEIKTGEVRVGDRFFYTELHYEAPSTQEIGEITAIHTTKTGRIKLTVKDSSGSETEWSNAPVSPNSYIQR